MTPRSSCRRPTGGLLTDLEITGSDILLRLNGSSDNEVTRSIFHDAGGECIRFRNQSQRNRFTDNVVYTCGLQGFNVKKGTRTARASTLAPRRSSEVGSMASMDHSNNNVVERNWFRTDGSEAVDIKEDSEQNIVRNNTGIGSKDPDGGIFGARGDNNQFLEQHGERWDRRGFPGRRGRCLEGRARSAERPGLRQEQRLPGQRRRRQPGTTATAS